MRLISAKTGSKVSGFSSAWVKASMNSFAHSPMNSP
jgi:hypothetical protein